MRIKGWIFRASVGESQAYFTIDSIIKNTGFIAA
jgi:hypothetical protein